ncbi:MAG: hypothetical protein H0X67_10395 [Acidobacteria bacterium]|nr:hypothetical protein [Acidobacteriota bacterium]
MALPDPDAPRPPARSGASGRARHAQAAWEDVLQESLVRHPALPDVSRAKVRYYGLWSVAHRTDRTRARALLTAVALRPPPPAEPTRASCPADLPRCPHCRVGTLIGIAVLRPWWSRPP